MLKLYSGARSRALIIQWYLEELDVPYELVMLDMKAGQHLQPDFLAVNPFGKVPALVDGDLKLSESGAILLYLAQKYDRPTSIEQQAQSCQWVLFANSTLTGELLIETTRERALPRLMTPLNQRLGQQPFLLGTEFTVADVAVGATLSFVLGALQLDLSAYPHVQAYIGRLSERPAFARAMGMKPSTSPSPAAEPA